ncbi:MAG: AI-2E family transporter [Chloroflexi bacterium]|nr:AI-2E family transporter [Chloroflexota bacterium]
MQVSTGRMTLGEWTLRVFVTLLLGTLFLALWTLRDVFLLTFLAMIVAIVLQIPVQRLERLGVSRGLSILISLGGTLLVLGMAVLLIVPVFVGQVRDLSDDLPEFIDTAKTEYDEQEEKNDWLPKIDWDNVAEDGANDLMLNQAGRLSRSIFPFLSGVGGALTSLLFMFFIAIFFVTGPANYLEGLLTMIPRGYRPRAYEIFQQLGELLRRWFVGQLISMTISGALITFVTGVIIGLPNPVALGVIAGLMEFIPNFGSIIAVVPALIIALAEDPVLVPFTLLAYLITQQIQSNVIMPRIMSRQISIPAASILVSQIIGATLFGFMGVLLALPLAIVLMVLIREIYVFDLLNTRPARLERFMRQDGKVFTAVTVEVYRPEKFTPGEAAKMRAEGGDLFASDQGQVVEIITPVSPALEQAVRGQQAVWVAILALTVAQGLALVRSLLDRKE